MTADEFRREVLVPFFVGMGSLVIILGIITAGLPEWVALLPFPAVWWASWKLSR